jgi:hypothetical protein
LQKNKTTYISMVLEDDEPSREEFAEIMEDLGFTREAAGGGDADTYREDWFNADRTVYVEYVEEPRLETRFLLVSGPGSLSVYEQLSDNTGCFGVDTLYRHAAEAATHNDAVMAMFRLVASEQVAPNMPSAAEAVFEHFLAQDHWMTRRAAVQAISYAGWPESLKILKRVASEDPDERVREFAARQIEPVRRHLTPDRKPGWQ